MTRRAFTLIEVVLSLALISSLTIATVSWSSAVIRLRQSTLDRSESTRAYSTFGRLIRADLLNEDALALTLARRTERLRVGPHSLAVLTRDGGPVEVMYTFDEPRGLITRVVTGLSQNSSPSEPVTVYDHVRSCRFQVDARADERWAQLTIAITADGEPEQNIQLIVPREWLP